jgi:hypothetical protein
VCSARDVANKTLPAAVTTSAGNAQSRGRAGLGEIILSGNVVISVAVNGGQVGVLFGDGRSAPAATAHRRPSPAAIPGRRGRDPGQG